MTMEPSSESEDFIRQVEFAERQKKNQYLFDPSREGLR